MNTVLDLIYRLLAHPTDAMSDVTTGEKMKESSIIWGFVVLLLALSSVEAGSFVTAFLASFVGTGSLLLIHSAVADYISGMSDEFATRLFEELFVPQKWQVL